MNGTCVQAAGYTLCKRHRCNLAKWWAYAVHYEKNSVAFSTNQTKGAWTLPRLAAWKKKCKWVSQYSSTASKFQRDRCFVESVSCYSQQIIAQQYTVYAITPNNSSYRSTTKSTQAAYATILWTLLPREIRKKQEHIQIAWIIIHQATYHNKIKPTASTMAIYIKSNSWVGYPRLG